MKRMTKVRDEMSGSTNQKALTKWLTSAENIMSDQSRV